MEINARGIVSPLNGYFGGTGEVRLNVRCDSCIVTADAAIRVLYYLRLHEGSLVQQFFDYPHLASFYLIFLVFLVLAVVIN